MSKFGDLFVQKDAFIAEDQILHIHDIIAFCAYINISEFYEFEVFFLFSGPD